MRKSVLGIVMVSACSCLVAALPTSAAQIYVADDSGNFVRYNTLTGTYSLIGNNGTILWGLAYASDGTLYANDDIPAPNNSLYTVNTTTGALTFVTHIGSSGGAGVIVTPASGSPFYFTNSLSTNTLYSLNVATGALTSIGGLGFSIAGNWDLAYGPNGELYASSNGSLYQINTSTGAGTLIGSFGGGLAMQSIIAGDGVLYGFDGFGMYTIDLTDAAANFVRDTPSALSTFESEASAPSAAVPEPPAWTLVLSGLGLLAGSRLRRERKTA